MSRVSNGVFHAGADVELAGGNLTLVLVVAAIALVALAMAFKFRSEVLAAGAGTESMRNIAQAVQEGAAAYLTRQFRTIVRRHGKGFVTLLREERKDPRYEPPDEETE